MSRPVIGWRRATFGVIGLLALVACGGANGEPAAETCAEVVLVGVRGQSQSSAAHLGLGTEVYRIAVDLANRVERRTGDSVRLESIDYDSAAPPDADAYDRAVEGGVVTLRDRLATLADRCPGSDLVVLGFSEGANVVHSALASPTALGSPTAARVRAVGLVADPRRAPAGDVEQVTFGTHAVHPGRLGPGLPLGPISARSISFCNAGDNVCNRDPGDLATTSNAIHSSFYEQPDIAAQIAGRLDDLLRR